MSHKINLIFILSVLVIPTSVAQNWEINMTHNLNATNSSFLRHYSSTISNTSYIVCIGVPTALATWGLIKKDKDLFRDALYIGSSVIEAFAISGITKSIVNRDRPFEAYPDRLHPYERPESSSFPSGHTASAFSLATSLSLRYPHWYVIAPSAVWACSVGYSRMQRGAHYPTDVLSGAIIGVGCAVANVYVNRWLNRKLFGDK
ncbi:MAG: phosphatase PAP2 family protein [Bacteroidaceae bacterium]